MFEDRLHLLIFQYFIEGVYLKILPSNCEMICDWIELNAMNGFLELELLYHLVCSFINNIESALLSSRYYEVALTGHSIDIRFVNIGYFLTKTAYAQVPYSNLFILPSRYTQLIILKSHIFNFFMSF